MVPTSCLYICLQPPYNPLQSSELRVSVPRKRTYCARGLLTIIKTSSWPFDNEPAPVPTEEDPPLSSGSQCAVEVRVQRCTARKSSIEGFVIPHRLQTKCLHPLSLRGCVTYMFITYIHRSACVCTHVSSALQRCTQRCSLCSYMFYSLLAIRTLL